MAATALDHYVKVQPASRAEWRAWLAKNHAQKESVWLVMPKKGSGIEGVGLSDAVDEALCFGWIDSLPRKLDDQFSMLLVSPRKAKSNWSAVNKAKVERLAKAGLIAPSGQKMIDLAKANGT
ncbi:MAG: YdeI/OmpD-associated family protein, partial [Notoacmeibacter sp.]